MFIRGELIVSLPHQHLRSYRGGDPEQDEIRSEVKPTMPISFKTSGDLGILYKTQTRESIRERYGKVVLATFNLDSGM